MPDVGILNLQIHDDSAKAAEGLSKLVAKLGEMKEAASKIRLGTVATGIKRINDELNKVQPSAIYKLKQLADALDRIGSISGNVGGIRISFGGRGQNAEDIAAQLQAARDAVAQTTTGFEQIGQHIQEDVHGAETFAGAMGRVNEIVQQTGWTAQTTAEQFAQMFQAMNSMRMSRSLDAGTNPFALGDGTGGSGAGWTYWKDGAIEVEGTVTDAMEAMAGTIDEVREKLINLADGTITVGAGERVFASLEEDARSMGISVEEAKRRIYDFASGVTEQTQTVNGTIDAMDQLKQRYMDMSYGNLFGSMFRGERGERDQSAAIRMAAEKAGTSIDNIRAKMREWDAEMRGASSIQNSFENMSVPTGIADEISSTAEAGSTAIGVFGRLSSVMHSFGRTMSRLPEMFQNLKSGIKSMFPTLTGLAKRFGGIMKYRALRAVLRHITDGFKTGYENFKNYSDAIGSDFSSGIASANAQLLTMKNSIGAAIAPAIQAALPILQTLTNWAVTAFNAVNQLLSLLTGKSTWSKAVAASADSLNDVEKAAGGAGSAVKDLLADWDELNIIQSESGGGGGGGGAGNMSEYLNMFEEVDQFDKKIKDITDTIRENMSVARQLAINAGKAILGWKISKAFAGTLGKIGTISAAGAIIEMTWEATILLDKIYMKNGDKGWLVADALVNLVGDYAAGRMVASVLGSGQGAVTMGVALTISGGISYGIALANPESDKADAIKTLGIIKAVIGDLIASAGFVATTGSLWQGLALGTGVTVPLFVATAMITYIVETNQNAHQIAAEAYKNGAIGGLNIEDLYKELQKVFDEASSKYNIVIDVFKNVPDLRTQFANALTQVEMLTAIIRTGGQLTPEEAESFRAAWGTVLSTFQDITRASFQTALASLNSSLSSANAEVRRQAKELRIGTLSMEKQISEAEAAFLVDMQELEDKVAYGTATSDEFRRYEAYVESLANMNDQLLSSMEGLVIEGTKVDVSDPSEVTDYILKINTSYEEAMAKIEEGYTSAMDAWEIIRRKNEEYHRLGYITDPIYEQQKQWIEESIANITEQAEIDKERVKKAKQDAYGAIIESAMEGIKLIPKNENTGLPGVAEAAAYLHDYISPLIKTIEEAGGEVSDELKQAVENAVYIDTHLVYGRSAAGKIKKAKEDLREYISNMLGLEPDESIDIEPYVESQDAITTSELLGVDVSSELEPVIIPVEFELESGIDMSSLLKDFEFDLKLSSINVPDEEDYNGYIFGRAFAKSTDLLMNNTGSYNYPDGSASNTVNNGSNVEEDVNRGTAQGFGTLSAQLATANALLTALLNKQFVATVAPTAGTGHGLQTAINAFNNLTGNGV